MGGAHRLRTDLSRYLAKRQLEEAVELTDCCRGAGQSAVHFRFLIKTRRPKSTAAQLQHSRLILPPPSTHTQFAASSLSLAVTSPIETASPAASQLM